MEDKENKVDKTTFENAAKSYYKSVHFWGQFTLILGIIFSCAGAVYLGFIKGYFPGWKPIITAFLSIFGVMGFVFFDLPSVITNNILMGPAAQYMSSLTGNVANMRLPSALSAKAAVDCGPIGGPKEHIIASIGVVASTIVNTTFLIIMVVAGTFIIKILPESFQNMLNYILPALFGAIFIQFALMDWKASLVALGVSILMLTAFASIIPNSYHAFLTVIICIVINVLWTNAMIKKQRDAEKAAENH